MSLKMATDEYEALTLLRAELSMLTDHPVVLFPSNLGHRLMAVRTCRVLARDSGSMMLCLDAYADLELYANGAFMLHVPEVSLGFFEPSPLEETPVGVEPSNYLRFYLNPIIKALDNDVFRRTYVSIPRDVHTQYIQRITCGG